MTDRLTRPDYARSRAVLVGTWDYDRLTPVGAARNSLTRMRRLLTGPWCGWPSDRVTVLGNQRDPGTLSDRLFDLFEDATDVALFYYVGHGQIDDEDQLCLGLVGSRTEPERRAHTSLEFTDVRRALRHCSAATKVVILDCCFSGLATHPGNTLSGSAEEVLERTTRTGAYTMTASSADTTAWYETDERLREPQTYFTKYLADLVEAGIPGQPAELKLHPLFKKLHDKLALDRRPIPQERSVDAARDFVFARNAAPPRTIVDPHEELARLRQRVAELERLSGQAARAGTAPGAAAAVRSPASAPAGNHITEHRLANGLRVVLCEDHNTPVAAVNLWYDVGSRREPKGRTGLAHLFCKLFFYGSASVSGNGHWEYIQNAGGSLNATTSFERSNFFQTVPAHELEPVLWLEADRMGSLLVTVDEQRMEWARDTTMNERRQRYDNQPYGTAFEKLTALCYPPDHPYHHTPIGSNADRDAVTVAEAHEFFRSYYTPNNAVLAVVGDIDPERTLAWVEKYFGSIPAHDTPALRDSALPDTLGGQLREVVEEHVPARAMMAAYRLPMDGTRACDAADLALTVLGGGESSRLYNRLVRRDRTAVAAGFGLLRLAGAPSLGWLDVKTSGAAEVRFIEAAVDEELARFAKEGPTPQEMERAQAQLEREWLDRLGTVAGRADELCRYATLFGDPRLAFTTIRRLLDVTAEEVQEIAASRLRPDNRAVLVYEPVTDRWTR
jgi:predicted Zn-dependent peptidase